MLANVSCFTGSETQVLFYVFEKKREKGEIISGMTDCLYTKICCKEVNYTSSEAR